MTLIERLRATAIDRGYPKNMLLNEAADRIEELERRVQRLEGYSDGLSERITNARAALGV